MRAEELRSVQVPLKERYRESPETALVTLRAFVDGKPYAENIRDIVLKAHEQITLVVGKPVPAPPRYTFPQGL